MMVLAQAVSPIASIRSTTVTVHLSMRIFPDESVRERGIIDARELMPNG